MILNQYMERDKAYLEHILDAIEAIEGYTKGFDRDKFTDSMNKMVQDATVRQLEIIGEAVGKLSDEIKKRNSELSWRDISGMRNKLIHEYFGVDLNVVWSAVEKDIPFLKKSIRVLIER